MSARGTFSAVDVAAHLDGARLWQEIANSSPDAWLWHTRACFEFNLCAGEKYAAKDASFFVFEGEEAVALVPCVVEDTALPGTSGKEAAYYSGILPWPAVRGGYPPERREALENFMFAELEERARRKGAGRIPLLFAPPQPADTDEARVRALERRGYTAAPVGFHLVDLKDEPLSGVRERFHRYHKKFAPLFDFSFAAGAAVSAAVEESYFRLHAKDAGGQLRSRESYRKQADLARSGEAFYISAAHRESGAVAGMLLVSLYKGAAYDNSVAIDPHFAPLRVGILLKWAAIEELMRRGAATYELGVKVAAPTALRIPSAKEDGISIFKEGFSRGRFRTRFEAEKFLDPKLEAAYHAARAEALARFAAEKSAFDSAA